MTDTRWLLTGVFAASLLTACGGTTVAPPMSGATPTQAMADVIASAAMKSTRLYLAKVYVVFGSFSVVGNNTFGTVTCGVTPTHPLTICTGSFNDVITNPELSTRYARKLTYTNFFDKSQRIEGIDVGAAVNGSSQYTLSAYVSERDNTRQYSFDLTFTQDLAILGQVNGTATCVDVSVFVDTNCTFQFPGFQLNDKEFFGNRFTVNADLPGVAGTTTMTFGNWKWNAGKTLDATSTVQVKTADGTTAVVKGSDTNVATVDITVAGVTTTFSSTLR
jgi:hypothetical protein